MDCRGFARFGFARQSPVQHSASVGCVCYESRPAPGMKDASNQSCDLPPLAWPVPPLRRLQINIPPSSRILNSFRICGGEPLLARVLNDMPVSAFHGGKDLVVP